MKKILLLVTALLTCSLPATAVTINDVDVPDSITTNEKTLVLNGAGMRKKAWFKLYVGALFTQAKTSNAADVVDGAIPAAIRLNITSSMITSEKLADALSEGFDLATGGDTSAIEKSIHAFVANTFTEAVSEGDQFTLVSVPGEGVYSYKNGKQVSVNKDDAFRKALMSVWLGKEPTDAKLKAKMLKG